MSINLYDTAITDKIKSWVLDPNVTVLYPDETSRFFSQVADSNNDKISLPLITIGRDRDITINNISKNPKVFSGRTLNSINGRSDHLNSIPITIQYQLNIYTRYRAEADEYLRNFIFNLINYPTLTIELPYQNSNITQKSFIELNNSITDNSDIPERLISGQFTRITLGLTLRDAQLYSYTFKNIPQVEEVELKLDETGKDHIAEEDKCVLDTSIDIN